MKYLKPVKIAIGVCFGSMFIWFLSLLKHMWLIAIVIAGCLVYFSQGTPDFKQADHFGFKQSEFTVVEENDSHGGFLGDGTYSLILDCSKNASRAHALIQDWKPLPLSENLNLVMYGGSRGGVRYAYDFAEEAHWPVIRNGVYKFVDRHNDAIDESDDTDLLNRYSFNFSIAVYDLDTDTLYYFELDT